MLVEALQAYITGNAGMISLLGSPTTRSDSSNGVWPTQAPDEPTMPYIVFQQISQDPESETFEGTGKLFSARWRFSCYGSTYKQAKKLANRLRPLLLAMRGAQGSANCEVYNASLKLEADDAENIGRGTLFGTHVDVEFVFDDLDA